MSFKGFNSILFDFDSIVDIELSVIQWMRHEYRDTAMDNFDKHTLLYTPMEKFEFGRIYWPEDVFSSIITNQSLKPRYKDILDSIIDSYKENIFVKSFMYPTAMQNLIRAYKKAGDGVIKTTVRCSNEEEKKYIESILDCPVILSKPEDVDMSKYTRLITGSVDTAMKYKLYEPKSILILNFRENFVSKDITMLRPELVISLGDIHDIRVISAYTVESSEDVKP